ncbi:MAG: TM2 domain-containing protein [Gammaproteobacteria bacterium]|jgi:TM2 domain-containing membrane protein YozV|nr:TM2 domain-containing protein [Gammaproteobacteria bacterium]MBP7909834.1 TM2 domain-containing protein [Pseudomonadales bacterium]
MGSDNTHSKIIGYLLWIFGFMGAHRFYFGKPVTGTIWFLTLGLLGIGWIIDLFLIPGMHRDAERRFREGPIDYDLGWILLTFLGVFGVHRFYMGKWLSGLLYLFTGGLFLLGVLYDYWTLNRQIDELAGQSG